ncbi:hypothetical protein B0H19DRAFT_1261451 [Mycena capillaripes]|nr:hypothetical protein B0H19DRAFT_1261451 [Mycena capillaripes]
MPWPHAAYVTSAALQSTYRVRATTCALGSGARKDTTRRLAYYIQNVPHTAPAAGLAGVFLGLGTLPSSSSRRGVRVGVPGEREVLSVPRTDFAGVDAHAMSYSVAPAHFTALDRLDYDPSALL